MPTIILLVVALVLFALAGCNVPAGRVALGWLGAAAFTAAQLAATLP